MKKFFLFWTKPDATVLPGLVNGTIPHPLVRNHSFYKQNTQFKVAKIRSSHVAPPKPYLYTYMTM